MGISARMSAAENTLARSLYFDKGKKPARIAELMGRSVSSITLSAVGAKKAPKLVGRPPALSDATLSSIVALLGKMVGAADGNFEVTMPMLMRRGNNINVCEKVVANALHERGYWFRGMRQKPILTPDDVKSFLGHSTTSLPCRLTCLCFKTMVRNGMLLRMGWRVSCVSTVVTQ